MLKNLLAALLIFLGTSGNASAQLVAVDYASMFAGFPSGHSQHGLTELQPALFAGEQLKRETGCLAAALYFEARGESRLGQIAVAQVIINRTLSRAYPNTVCRVVWQNADKLNRCQFSFTCDGKADNVRDRSAWVRAKAIAKSFLEFRAAGTIPHAVHPSDSLDRQTRRSTHYHATYVEPGWSRELEKMTAIGRHIFYVSRRVERTMPKDA